MAWEDIRDGIDSYMASLVGIGYSGWSGRASIKASLLTAIARGVFDELGGTGSTVHINETPDLPATTFSSTPANQYIADATSGRGWGTYWENAIGTLVVDANGWFKHTPNLAQDQQMIMEYNRAPRLTTNVLPLGPRMVVEAEAKMVGVASGAGGFAHAGVGVFGIDSRLGNFAHAHLRLNRDASNLFSARANLVLENTSETLVSSSSDASLAAGTDFRITLEKNNLLCEYRGTGGGSYTTLTTLNLGRFVPLQVIVFLGHVSALPGPAPDLYVRPTLIRVETP